MTFRTAVRLGGHIDSVGQQPLRRARGVSDVQRFQINGAHMYVPRELNTLDFEIRSFSATLRQCFRGASWDAVSYYAEDAWSAAARAGARWQDVESRVRTAWEAADAVARLRRLEAAKLVN